MLRNANYMRRVLRVSPRTIVHIGADKGQDRPAYKNMGARSIYWGEADPESEKSLRRNFPEDTVIGGLFWDTPDNLQVFYKTMHSAQNSAIKPLQNSDIQIDKETMLITKTLDGEFLDKPLEGPIMLVVDVQGAEEKVLAGGRNFLKNAKFVVIEIAISSQGYSFTPLESSIDQEMVALKFRKSIFRLGKSGTYKDQLYLRASKLRISMIRVLDFAFDFTMRSRHRLLTGHKTTFHYHCGRCNF